MHNKNTQRILRPAFTREEIEHIRDEVDLCELLARYAGAPRPRKERNARMRCPFHDGASTQSLSVSYRKQVYHCFVCKASGDVFRAVMALERLTFLDAVHHIYKKELLKL